ncbi:AHH domain-containing protein [Bacillus paramycoides]|uniref:AHH domain-containing protein n=1 Tax=Bacillus paramycoides TaxID=2026194 RepID=UPI002E1F3F4A|nr:T7SS effector LXG polymorphic toxin [Bacillus paramycoides]MED1462547.1 T7SS effector LXG polymorphic toxin [Bacillus paramycoides]MED1494010.1 T7SS effector LXG polymorphic toxin [Bacillus paramycoides]
MGFQVDLKEFNEILAKLQKDTSKTNEQLEQAKNALHGIIQADAMQGATGNAIVNDINNNQSAVVTGLKVTNEFLIMEMLTTLKDFQSTTGESDENAVILEDALLQAQNKLSNLQPKKHEMDSRISNIYNSVNDLVSLSMPNSQFDEKLVAASKELEDTIQKVQQFESKKEKSNAEDILDALNKQVQMARGMSSLSYTDPQLQDFFAQDELAKGIHEMDTQITKVEKEAQLQAEGEMKKKQEEWAEHHPLEAWLQNVSASIGEKWDGLEKGTRWLGMLGTNYPALKRLSDETLMLEGFIGKAGSAISEFAIGGIKVGFLLAELADWGYNSIRGVEIEQWKLDDLDATWQGVKKLTEYGIVGSITNTAPFLSDFLNNPALTDKIPVLDNLARTFRRDQKEMSNAVKDYVEKALTDHYAFGGVGFDIISCLFGVGEVNTAVKGSAAAGKIAEGENIFQAAGKRGKIGGKSEEVTALMNKLPNSIVEKIKNIEIPNLFEPSYAGIGGERKTLGELFSVANSGTRGTGNVNRIIPGTPGVVTGGNSTKLGKNMMTEMGLKRSTKWSGYQAQHIIPSEMANNPVIKKIGMNFDDSSNGIFLRVPDDNISTMARHRGYHSVYNEVVARALNKMDINQSIDSLQKQVYDLQKNLRKLQGNGLPLYPSQGATVELWERKLKQLEIQNK